MHTLEYPNEPPSRKAIVLILLILVAFLMLWSIWGLSQVKKLSEANESEKIALQQQEAAIKTRQLFLKNWEKELLVDEIIQRESTGDPKACNKELGCRAGMGLMGFISGTWNETLRRMSLEGYTMPQHCWQLVYLPVSRTRTEPIFDGECNRTVGTWLLEKDGIRHWEGNREWGSGPYNIDTIIGK